MSLGCGIFSFPGVGHSRTFRLLKAAIPRSRPRAQPDTRLSIHMSGAALIWMTAAPSSPIFQNAWKRILPNVLEVEDSTDFFKSGAASVDVVR